MAAGILQTSLCVYWGRSTTKLPHRGRWISLVDIKCEFPPKFPDAAGWPRYDMGTFGVTMVRRVFGAYAPRSVDCLILGRDIPFEF